VKYFFRIEGGPELDRYIISYIVIAKYTLEQRFPNFYNHIMEPSIPDGMFFFFNFWLYTIHSSTKSI